MPLAVMLANSTLMQPELFGADVVTVAIIMLKVSIRLPLNNYVKTSRAI